MHQNLQGEVVLVNLQTNGIYALNTTGARLWELLAEGYPQGEIRQRLLDEFAVSEGELDRELGQFLAFLQSERLVVDAGT